MGYLKDNHIIILDKSLQSVIIIEKHKGGIMLNNSKNRQFINTINYLQNINTRLNNLDEIETPEEQLLIIIQNALFTSPQNAGSIFFKTDEYGNYTVSDIQPHSYNWPLKGKTINLESIISTCNKLGIAWSINSRLIYAYQKNHHEEKILDQFGNPIVRVDTEFSFGVTIKQSALKNKTKKKTK